MQSISGSRVRAYTDGHGRRGQHVECLPFISSRILPARSFSILDQVESLFEILTSAGRRCSRSVLSLSSLQLVNQKCSLRSRERERNASPLSRSLHPSFLFGAFLPLFLPPQEAGTRLFAPQVPRLFWRGDKMISRILASEGNRER